ncbi:MAG: ABC transporter permease [Acidobacteriaceae bacterium]|nr:ABC transporter permease [Acidobacteriaceae bacterium]MBV9499481.1 ABC transporter permease [Acidobacteriaceae bacterium]
MTDSSLAVRGNLPCSARMPGSRLFRAYLTEAKYECLRSLRMPGFAAPFLVLPFALYLFFGVVLFGSSKEPNTALYIFLAFAVFGVMGPGMFGFGVFVATEREQSLITLKRALPAPPAANLLAKMLMATLFAVLVMITMIGAALFIAHLRLTFAQFLSQAVINVLGSLPFCALGLFIGTRASGKSAPAFVNLMYLPMIYLSGFFFPLPHSIHWIQFASPAFYLDQLALSAVGLPASGTPLSNAAVLVAVTLLFGALAVRRLARVG